MDFQTIIILILLIYTVIISVLYFSELYDRDKYHRNKEMILHDKEDELIKRESIIVDKEICFRELTKIKTIQLESVGNNIITKTIQFFSDTILLQNKNNTVSILQRKSTSQPNGRMAQPVKRMVKTPTTESEITPIPTEPVVLDETYYGYQNTTSTTPWNN